MRNAVLTRFGVELVAMQLAVRAEARVGNRLLRQFGPQLRISASNASRLTSAACISRSSSLVTPRLARSPRTGPYNSRIRPRDAARPPSSSMFRSAPAPERNRAHQQIPFVALHELRQPSEERGEIRTDPPQRPQPGYPQPPAVRRNRARCSSQTSADRDEFRRAAIGKIRARRGSASTRSDSPDAVEHRVHRG